MQGPANGWHRSLRYAFSEFTIWMSSLDPFGAFCSSLTIILIVYSQYVTVYLIILSSSGLDYIHSLLYTACSIFALMSHFRAQFADPGFVPRHYIPQTMPQAQIFDGVRTSATILQAKKVSLPPVCRKCKTVKPKGAHHCSICTRCIARMDHHCPWINNCVAALNQKYFIQFLCWTGVLCLYSGSIIGAGIYRCAIDSDKCSDVSPNIIILVFLNLFEAVLFGCFVAVMLWDQLSAIFENTPYIDKLQGIRNSSHATRMTLLTEVFGEPIGWNWIFPTRLPKRVAEELYDQCETYCAGNTVHSEDEFSDDDD